MDTVPLSAADITGYRWRDPELNVNHAYLLPTVDEVIKERRITRLFDLGCGNGSVCARYAGRGLRVTGVDPSTEGIQMARSRHPQLDVHPGSAYDDLAARYGRFPCVLSLEVVEHLYDPRRYAATLFDLLEPGGTAILSTPYHGYWKNLALALAGQMDGHYTALWDHGHIKFWSIQTLSRLLAEAGFESTIRFHRVGRIPALAKSMVAIATRPTA